MREISVRPRAARPAMTSEAEARRSVAITGAPHNRAGSMPRTTARERARLAQLRYDNGSAAYLEVLDAQRDLLDAEQQLVQARRALLSNEITLYAALGGGTQTSASTR